jgi:hypothetical protein
VRAGDAGDGGDARQPVGQRGERGVDRGGVAQVAGPHVGAVGSGARDVQADDGVPGGEQVGGDRVPDPRGAAGDEVRRLRHRAPP